MIEVLRQAFVDQPLRRAAGDGDSRSAIVSHNNATRAKESRRHLAAGEKRSIVKKNETEGEREGVEDEREDTIAGTSRYDRTKNWEPDRMITPPWRNRIRNEFVRGGGDEARGDTKKEREREREEKK